MDLKKLNVLKFLKEEKAQVSVEFLIVLGLVILVALLVGFYVKQLSGKKAGEANDLKNQTFE
ncbi:MAG: class III signal peptide-containing protein [Candidatus ainarchaeum sp.]|nr:class III signal peptide-containing protein [Candidatus ainarchaeum sp.]MDD3975879.1 class III signal peptide-containing protein [Candidatus ainarchaeum sp.]